MIILLGIKLANGHAFFYYDNDYFHIAHPYRDNNVTLSSFSGANVVMDNNEYLQYYLEFKNLNEMAQFVRDEHIDYVNSKVRIKEVKKEWHTLSPACEETMVRMMDKAIRNWIPDGNREGAKKLLMAVVNLPNIEQRDPLVTWAKKLEWALN